MLIITLLLHLFSVSNTPEAVPTAEVPASVFLSTNQGGTWENFMTGLPEDLQPRNLVEDDHQNLYLSSHQHGVFVLRHAAQSWTPIREGLPYADEFFLPTSLAVKGTVIIVGTYQHGVYFSHDGGTHWRKASIDIPRATRSMIFTEKGLFAGTDRGLYHSFDNGDTWLHYGDDYTAIVNAFVMHNDRLFVVRQNGMGVLENNEIKWADVKSDWALIQATSAGEYAYAFSARGEIFRSADGITWEAKPAFSLLLTCNSLAEALWHGFEAELPGQNKSGTIIETSRGWVATVGGGC